MSAPHGARRMHRAHIVALLSLIVSAQAIWAQAPPPIDSLRHIDPPTRIDSLGRAALDGAPSGSSLLELFLPAGIRAGYLTRAWLRDSLPGPDDSLDDISRADLIYLRALGEAEGDIGTALLASLIACFEHRTIPLSIGIKVPLTLEPEDAFERRVARLPRHLFADNWKGDDRDKLQHFFASAWLAWMLDGREAADVIGLGVEAGEKAFVDGGADDPRDVRANRLGQLYVELLRRFPRALPGTMFRAWNRRYLRR